MPCLPAGHYPLINCARRPSPPEQAWTRARGAAYQTHWLGATETRAAGGPGAAAARCAEYLSFKPWRWPKA